MSDTTRRYLGDGSDCDLFVSISTNGEYLSVSDKGRPGNLVVLNRDEWRALLAYVEEVGFAESKKKRICRVHESHLYSVDEPISTDGSVIVEVVEEAKP